LNVTTLFAAVVLKFVPVKVTDAPAAPLFGLRFVIVGGGIKVKLVLVALLGPTMTWIGPVVALLGTVATSLVVEADVMLACAPLNLTMFAEIVEPKFEPLIVTEIPGPPLGGLKPVMVGLPPAQQAPMLARNKEENWKSRRASVTPKPKVTTFLRACRDQASRLPI